MTDPTLPLESSLAQALDTALAHGIVPPPLPAGFRARLTAAVARQGVVDIPTSRMALAAEHQQQLAALKSGYVRLQRRTLGTMIGAAFATGALVAVAMPWIRTQFGEVGLLAVPMAGAVVGIAIGATIWLRNSGIQRLLR
jgi:hypothetical protein